MSNIVPLSSSSNGRLSKKPWKSHKVHRDHRPSKSWTDRMLQTRRANAIKKLQTELKEEKELDFQRRKEIAKNRKLRADDKRRLEEEKIQMGLRKAKRLRRKAGRTQKIHH